MRRNPFSPWDQVEYSTILRAAASEGWLHVLTLAHHTACSEAEADNLLDSLCIPHLVARFTPRPHRGSTGRIKARWSAYRIILPNQPGHARGGRLRVGLVIHEAAHVLQHREYGAFGHGPEFQAIFRRLLTGGVRWSHMAVCSNYRTLYDRHRGPYSLILTRATEKTVKGVLTPVHSTDKSRGPFDAEDAHETARMLVGDPRDNVWAAYVYSETEGQFIGAYYERGQTIPAWADQQSALVPDDDGPACGGDRAADGDRLGEADRGTGLSPLPGSDAERLRRMDPADDPPDAEQPGDGDQVPEVRSRPVRHADRVVPGPVRPAARRGARLALDAGNAERWPKSQGPAIVRAWFEAEPGRTASVAEVIEALGGPLGSAGVQFPKSLISRLKQSGHLREVE